MNTRRSSPDPSVDRLARSLRDLVVAGDQLRRSNAAESGLGLSEFLALSQLSFGGPAGPTELARDLGLTPGSMTLLLDRLQEVGYIERAPHPSDRRRQIVNLTEAGRALHATGYARFTRAVARARAATAGPDRAELAELVTLSDAIVLALRSEVSGPT